MTAAMMLTKPKTILQAWCFISFRISRQAAQRISSFNGRSSSSTDQQMRDHRAFAVSPFVVYVVIAPS
jgi:hypothetical protein